MDTLAAFVQPNPSKTAKRTSCTMKSTYSIVRRRVLGWDAQRMLTQYPQRAEGWPVPMSTLSRHLYVPTRWHISNLSPANARGGELTTVFPGSSTDWRRAMRYRRLVMMRVAIGLTTDDMSCRWEAWSHHYDILSTDTK